MGDEERKILVVGGGISGMTAAIEAAEVGADVVLVEKNPYLGGRVALLNQVLSQALPYKLRPGDKLQAHQTKSQDMFPYAGGSGIRLGRTRQL